MNHPCAGLDLVAVLPSGAGTGEERDLEVLVLALQVGLGCCPGGVQNCHGHRGAVNPTAPLPRRDALHAMAPGLLVELLDTRAVQVKSDKGIALAQVGQRVTRMLSADAIGVTQVGLGQLCSKQTGIGAALGRTEFDLTLCHDTSPGS